MTTTPPTSRRLLRQPMTGRDPQEDHRTATPLELLYDLTFVIAFGAIASQLAHAIADGHTASGLIAFAFGAFAVPWAWINYSWWASAFDTDDWYVRVCTLVQMVGVIVLSLGVPEVFDSVEHEVLDNSVMVLGYIIMRIGMIALWVRVAIQDPAHRRAALIYITTLVTAQIGWVFVAVAHLPLAIALAVAVPLYLIELAGPVIAESGSSGTPWHAHHIAERYSLLVLITLGEVVLGTATTVNAIVHESGWSWDAGVVAFAGIALAFALWWVAFSMPSGHALHVRRGRGFVWGYGHILVFASLVAVGAGLDVAALTTEGESHLTGTAVALSAAVPVAIFLVTMFALYGYLVGSIDPLHIALCAGAVGLLGVAVLVAASGAGLTVWLIPLVFAPIVVILGHEISGRHRNRARLRELEGAASPTE